MVKVILRQQTGPSVHFYHVLMSGIFRIIGMIQIEGKYLYQKLPILLPSELPVKYVYLYKSDK